MKIRTDFVTNSSSVSYILTMHKEIVDNYLELWGEHRGAADRKVAERLSYMMLKDGTRCMIEGKEIHTKKVTFSTDEIQTMDTMDVQEENLDLSSLGSDDLWSFILGEYIMNGRISSLSGFGATQVETY